MSAALSKSCAASTKTNPKITGTSTTLSKNCTTPPATPRPNPAPFGNPLWGSRAPPLTGAIKTVVSLPQGSGGPRVRGSLSRRRRLQTDKSSVQLLRWECRPATDSSRCTCRPLASSRLHQPGPPQGSGPVVVVVCCGCVVCVVECGVCGSVWFYVVFVFGRGCWERGGGEGGEGGGGRGRSHPSFTIFQV